MMPLCLLVPLSPLSPLRTCYKCYIYVTLYMQLVILRSRARYGTSRVEPSECLLQIALSPLPVPPHPIVPDTK